MINVVLKKGSDYSAFKLLLEQHDYKFTHYEAIGRIFTIDTTFEAFTQSAD